MDEIIDDTLAEPKEELLESIKWWEKKRLLFNIILISVELFAMISMSRETQRFGISAAIIHSILFTIAANIFYCLGWGIEVLRAYYMKSDGMSETSKVTLFTLGAIFTVFTTFIGYANALVGI